MVPNLRKKFLFVQTLQLHKFEGFDFKYDYSFWKFQSKITQINNIWSQIEAFLFLKEILNIDQIVDTGFKYNSSFLKILPKTHKFLLLLETLRFEKVKKLMSNMAIVSFDLKVNCTQIICILVPNLLFLVLNIFFTLKNSRELISIKSCVKHPNLVFLVPNFKLFKFAWNFAFAHEFESVHFKYGNSFWNCYPKRPSKTVLVPNLSILNFALNIAFWKILGYFKRGKSFFFKCQSKNSQIRQFWS